MPQQPIRPERHEGLRLVASSSGPKVERLDHVRQAVRACAETDRHLAETVARARAAGATWSEVGQVLGITRQAAQQRYGGPR